MATDEACLEVVACLRKAADLLPGAGPWTREKMAWHTRLESAADMVLVSYGELLALIKTPAESARLAALAAWDDEQHRFYHDADLVPGSARWEEQYAAQAVLWGRLLRLLEAQREGATDGQPT